MTSAPELLARFALDLIAMATLLFGLFWPRYKNKEITLAAVLFNIFTFGVLSILSSVEFSIAAGFGLFAILALFNLRSEAINKSDIAYFFGSISIAVITSVDGTDLGFVLVILAIILLVVFFVDHPRFFRETSQVRVTLDTIPNNLLDDPALLNRELSEKLKVEVISTRVLSVDYVTEIVKADIYYKNK